MGAQGLGYCGNPHCGHHYQGHYLSGSATGTQGRRGPCKDMECPCRAFLGPIG